MKKAIMVVHDIKGKLFVQPHVCETTEIAIRDFTEAATDAKKETTLAKYPHDYELIHCGYFDPKTGEVEPIKPETVLCGKHIGKKDKQETPQGEIKAVN